MVKLSAPLFSALFFFVSAVGHSQTSAPVWFTLNVQEGQTVTATRSITLRFGQVASTCAYSESTGPCSAGAGAPSPAAWTSPQTFTGSIVSVVVGAAAFGNVDPLPGVSKTVQVEEQSTPQNITVNGQPVTVPALSGSSTPVWFTLNAQEGQTVTATGSITLRFGQVASTCAYSESTGPCSAGAGAPSPEAWTSPQTFTGSIVSVVVGAAAFGNVDPLPGVSKTVQVEEQSTPQNITVNGQPVTVPALSGSSTPVWFTLNAQEGQTVTATGSITLRFGQVASTCAYTESTGPCSCRRRRTQPRSLDFSRDFHRFDSHHSYRIGRVWQRRPAPWRTQNRAGGRTVDISKHHCKWAASECPGGLKLIHMPTVRNSWLDCLSEHHRRIHDLFFRQHF